MTDEVDLKVGSFYWVWIALDPDADSATDHDPGWENSIMPARFAGRGTEGQALWNYLGQESASDWPVRWIGDEITPPDEANPRKNPRTTPPDDPNHLIGGRFWGRD